VTTWDERPLRSLLFAPGNHPRKLAKLGTFGSDGIVLDLEDAVADAEKEVARRAVREALPSYADDGFVVVRVNGPETGRLEEDVRGVVCQELDCLMIPKVERPETLVEVDQLVASVEREHGLESGRIRLLALVETAKGLASCEAIANAAPSRLLTLIFGLADFVVDLELDLSDDGTELLYARSRVVVATRAAGLPQPLDGPFLDLPNLEGLDADTRRSRRLGFQGRVVIYPPHVEVVQNAYSSLTDEEAAEAYQVIEAFERSEAEGSASIQINGRFVDYPIYRRAVGRVKRYEQLKARR
jgi:citrate lyase subunit beta/citryl-CoA lyase